MNTHCRQFRNFVLEKDQHQPLNEQAQQHLQHCSDCRLFYRQYRQAFETLNKTKSPRIPERIQRKTEQRIFKAPKRFLPAYGLVALLFLFISISLLKQNHLPRSINGTSKIQLDYALCRGKPANVYMEENQNFVHIFISNKGE